MKVYSRLYYCKLIFESILVVSFWQEVFTMGNFKYIYISHIHHDLRIYVIVMLNAELIL